MNFEDFYAKYIEPQLTLLLADRLILNKTWDNVSLERRKNKLVVRWFDPKREYPHDKETFQEHAIPFRLNEVNAEIVRQTEKLFNDLNRA